jgi:hypothetical protein
MAVRRDRRWRLPYGRWRCGDGREVLFDRHYSPIASRRPGEEPELCDPGERVKDIAGRDWFYRDRTPERIKLWRAVGALREWGLRPEDVLGAWGGAE